MWQVRVNDIHANGPDQIVVLCDFFDDQVLAKDGTPLVQWSYAPSFPNSTPWTQVQQALVLIGQKVRDQRVNTISPLLSQTPPGALIPIP